MASMLAFASVVGVVLGARTYRRAVAFGGASQRGQGGVAVAVVNGALLGLLTGVILFVLVVGLLVATDPIG